MLPTDRLVLIDLENVVGFRPKPRTLRARVTALLDAAGPHHHAVAAYAVDDAGDDPIASALACLGVAPLRVAPGPDAAETALLAHAKLMQAEGCVLFTVCSSDHAFTALADTDAARIEVVIWQGQPVSGKLATVVDHVRRLPRPGTGSPAEESPRSMAAPKETDPVLRPRRPVVGQPVLSTVAGAVVIGVGIALGHRLADAVAGRVQWDRPRR